MVISPTFLQCSIGDQKFSKSKYCLQRPRGMTEASIIAFGVVIGMAIALAVTCFIIRGKGHHDEIPFTPPEETASE